MAKEKVSEHAIVAVLCALLLLSHPGLLAGASDAPDPRLKGASSADLPGPQTSSSVCSPASDVSTSVPLSIVSPEMRAESPVSWETPLPYPSLTGGIAPIVGEVNPPELIADGQFVYGPNVGEFDLREFLQERGSPLTKYAAFIDLMAAYSSVNPMLLLASLEARGGHVTRLSTEMTAADVEELIETAAMELATAFYEHLYRWGDRKPAGPESLGTPELILADGSTAVVEGEVSSGTYAVMRFLAQDWSSVTSLSRTVEREATSFQETFEALFPSVDLLDSSNSITPMSLPVDELFQFPFPVGETWYFGGPHSWNGGDAPPPYSSMDFFFESGLACTDDPEDFAAAAAPGQLRHARNWYDDPYDCWLEIDHQDGWTTSYYHLRETVPDGVAGRNDLLGKIGCETCAGGFSTGPHVHFSVKYNGAYVSLEGISLSGWTIHVGSKPYTSGWIERDGQILHPYAQVLNDYRGPFEDVLYYHWASDWITALYYAGYTSGCSTDPALYCPERLVSRSEMAVFVERGVLGVGVPPPPGQGNIFDDVGIEHWAVNWIEGLYAGGITSGCSSSPKLYCPDRYVTRAEMAVFLLRAKYGGSYTPPAATGTVFDDVPADHWAAAWIEALAQQGITAGCGESTYCPDQPVDRAQMAVFLVRTFNLPLP